jgi:hypothetical protein
MQSVEIRKRHGSYCHGFYPDFLDKQSMTREGEDARSATACETNH